jgi:hypothetical protein
VLRGVFSFKKVSMDKKIDSVLMGTYDYVNKPEGPMEPEALMPGADEYGKDYDE